MGTKLYFVKYRYKVIFLRQTHYQTKCRSAMKSLSHAQRNELEKDMMQLNQPNSLLSSSLDYHLRTLEII